jgi:tRNA (guanine37-N1)-methyltransferase
MSEHSPCIEVNKIHGEKTLILASKLGLTNRELKIQHSTNNICIPFVRNPEKAEIAKLKAQLPDFKLATKVFAKKKTQAKTLYQVLEDQLPPSLLTNLPRALDVIGDIAVINIPPELKTHKHLIGEALLEIHKNIQTVLAKVGAVTGTYRLRELEVIAGEHRTTTIHKEYGCQYHVDVATAYFSPRLSTEHNRVASLVQKGEIVIDLFAGVGPFSVLTAKNNADVRVYAVDINPEAVEFLKRNIRLNRVDKRVIPIEGNARQAVEEKLLGVADRVIMNLPQKAIEFVGTACKAIKSSGGIVHYYAFIRFPDSVHDAQQRFSKAVEKAGRKVDVVLSAKTIRETAPYEYQIVLDTKIR